VDVPARTDRARLRWERWLGDRCIDATEAGASVSMWASMGRVGGVASVHVKGSAPSAKRAWHWQTRSTMRHAAQAAPARRWPSSWTGGWKARRCWCGRRR